VERHHEFCEWSWVLSHLLQQSEAWANVVVLFAVHFLAYLLLVDCKNSGSSQFLFALECLQHTYTVVEKSPAVLSNSRNATVEVAKQISNQLNKVWVRDFEFLKWIIAWRLTIKWPVIVSARS
jgi:hypothetical protein